MLFASYISFPYKSCIGVRKHIEIPVTSPGHVHDLANLMRFCMFFCLQGLMALALYA